MQVIASSLGVACNYCHSAERGSGQPEPKKDIARAMIAMTRELNGKVAAATGRPPETANLVSCATCHRGVPIPKPLSDVLIQTVVQRGSSAAADQYRDLRQRFYGKAAYDFSEDTLIAAGQRLTNAGRHDDAIAIYKLNAEFFPRSTKTLAAIAFSYTRKLDDESAMKYLEQALEIEPENGVIRGQLEQLRSYRRRR
jgi:tetratricopeptide (TPR) repeat protein